MKTKILKLRLSLLVLLLLCVIFPAQAQDAKSFTLKEAMDYAVTNSYKTKTAALDFQSTVAQRKGFISLGLPQVNASSNYSYYVNIPTQLLPNFLTPAIEGTLLQYGLITPAQLTPSTGEKFPVQFGSKNNLSVGATASQLIFDGTFVVGLKAAKILVDMSKTSMDKSINETKASVAQAYYLTLIARENLRILDSTYINMSEILRQNKVIQTNGFMDETDIEQLTLNVSNLKSKLDFTRRNIALVTDLLKFQMGINIDDSIVLKDNINSLIDQAVAANIVDKQFEVKTHFDYKLIDNSVTLKRQTMKVDQAKYYPSMNLFFNTQSSAQREKFDFFNSGKWYNTTLVGVNLSIPIWSSGVRHYKIKEDKLNILKQEIIAKQVDEGLKIEVQNSKASLKMYTEQLYTDRNNFNLAIKIYKKTNLKFKEGLASSLDLNQAYLQLLTQEGNYINTMMQLLNTYTNLSKALNTL
jgi:outer membrane protein TolC